MDLIFVAAGCGLFCIGIVYALACDRH